LRKKFSVLFASDTTSKDDSSAVQRLLMLKSGLEKLGVETGMIYLADYPIGSPRLLLGANTPLFLKTARQYDFVHSPGLSILSSATAKPFASYKIIFDHQGSIEESPLLSKNSRFNFKRYYHTSAPLIAWQTAKKIADYFVTVSEPLRQFMVKRGIRPERTELLYNAVDTQLFKPAKEKFSGPFTVTYAGAYQKWQGIENLVDAVKILENTNIKFKFMGFQKRHEPVKRLIRAKLGNRVELLDFQPRTKNKQPDSFVGEMAQSDVLIIPRYTDPLNPIYSNSEYVRNTFGWLPTKFGEYIATGRPVIVTNLDVSADFVEQYDCGFVCKPDPKSLSHAILEASKTSVDELNKKGLNGRRLAEEQFDIGVIAEKYLKILSALL
jgi:glycosyltransferase involved in cell wall biosynthesis